MFKRKITLALAACSILILQAISFGIVPAKAQSENEWTGTIATDLKYTWTEFDGTRTVEITRSAEISFTVPEDPYSFGDITGQGSGSEEYNLHYTVSDGSGECPESHDQGSIDVTFELRGYVDEGTGKAILEMRQLTPYQYIVDRGCVGPYDSTGYYVYAFESWNTGSFEIDLQDGAVFEQDIGTGRDGLDRLTIHGSDTQPPVNNGDECPTLTITPTLPPASNPRKSAGPSDIASFRLQLDWTGPVPAEVTLEVINGDGPTIIPEFSFNPVRITSSSPTSVLMDVTTNHAAPGEYHLTVQAAYFDFNAEEPCTIIVATTEVVLVVTEHLSDLLLFCKVDGIQGSVLIFKPNGDWAAPEEDQEIETGDLIKTAVDGNLGIISSEGERIKLGRGTTVGTADLVVTPDGEAHIVLAGLADAENFPPVNDNQFWQDVATEFVDAHREQLGPLAMEAAVSGCDAVEQDVAILDCATHETYFFHQGYVHFANDEIQELSGITLAAPGHLWVTPSAVVRSLSAEFSMAVEPDGTTTVTTLQGSVWVADAKSKASVFVESGEQIVIPISASSGLSRGQMDQRVTTFDETKTDSWWSKPVSKQVQIGDYATATGVELTGDVSTPVGRRAVFSNQEEHAYVWINFVNVMPPEHTVDLKWYQPDGVLYASSTVQIEEPDSYWSSYTMYRYIEIKDAADKPGLWRVDVYSDGDFVKEISFSIVEPALVKDQFVKYELIDEVKSSDKEMATLFENEAASAFPESFTGVLAVSVGTPDDIEWARATVKDNSPGEAKIQTEVKVRGQQRPLTGEPESDFSLPLYIPVTTTGLTKGYVLQFTGEESDDDSPQLVLDKTVSIDIGGTSIQAYEFLGSSDGYTATVHYEKNTGILVGFLIEGNYEDDTGYVEASLGLKAIEIGIPTTLSISSIPGEVSQYSQLEITGKISPPVSNGQVILVYQKQGDNDDDNELTRRTVHVGNGTFSDKYMLEKDGVYAVSAEYLGSGAYLSSTSSPQALTVTPSGCLIATAAYGSEFAPQVQMLRQIRDNQLLTTSSGASFMSAFNSVYYSFSPTVANWERENPAFREAVRIAITPLITTLSILPHVSMDSEAEAIGYGIGIILLNIGIYFAAPAFAIMMIFHFKAEKKGQVG